MGLLGADHVATLELLVMSRSIKLPPWSSFATSSHLTAEPGYAGVDLPAGFGPASASMASAKSLPILTFAAVLGAGRSSSFD